MNPIAHPCLAVTPPWRATAARCAAAAACAALLLAAAPLQAATAPASDLVYRSIETPYPAPGPFHTNTTALLQFTTVADLDHGLSVRAVNLAAAPLGSFLDQASGLVLSVFNTDLTVTLRSMGIRDADIEAGANNLAFTDVNGSFRSVHVNAFGAAQDVTLLTLNFSRPVQGFAFLGAGMSDYGPSNQPGGPSQRIQLDDRPMIDVIGVPTNTVVNPLQLSFGVIAAQAFSQVRLVLPGNSANDNAALANLTIAFDPQAVVPVPEPATWALWAAGLLALGRLGHRRRPG